MDRREALKTTSFVVGYTLSASALAAALQACRTEPSSTASHAAGGWQPEYLEPDQARLVAELTETIIPETDTPGAKEVMLQEYIDAELKYMLSTDDQYVFIKGLEQIQQRAMEVAGKPFEGCSPEERTTILMQESESGGDFFPLLKRLTYSGYFTSEKICEDVLQYDPIPGQYLGCIDIDKTTRSWSL